MMLVGCSCKFATIILARLNFLLLWYVCTSFVISTLLCENHRIISWGTNEIQSWEHSEQSVNSLWKWFILKESSSLFTKKRILSEVKHASYGVIYSPTKPTSNNMGIVCPDIGYFSGFLSWFHSPFCGPGPREESIWIFCAISYLSPIGAMWTKYEIIQIDWSWS